MKKYVALGAIVLVTIVGGAAYLRNDTKEGPTGGTPIKSTLLLRPDGLGLVHVGQPMQEVIDSLIPVFGKEEDESSDWKPVDPYNTSCPYSKIRYGSYSNNGGGDVAILYGQNASTSPVFIGYIFYQSAHQYVGASTPVTLFTEKGLTPGPADEATIRQMYPDVQFRSYEGEGGTRFTDFDLISADPTGGYLGGTLLKAPLANPNTGIPNGIQNIIGGSTTRECMYNFHSDSAQG